MDYRIFSWFLITCNIVGLYRRFEGTCYDRVRILGIQYRTSTDSYEHGYDLWHGSNVGTTGYLCSAPLARRAGRIYLWIRAWIRV
jgi:hypothetical protein